MKQQEIESHVSRGLDNISQKNASDEGIKHWLITHIPAATILGLLFMILETKGRHPSAGPAHFWAMATSGYAIWICIGILIFNAFSSLRSRCPTPITLAALFLALFATTLSPGSGTWQFIKGEWVLTQMTVGGLFTGTALTCMLVVLVSTIWRGVLLDKTPESAGGFGLPAASRAGEGLVAWVASFVLTAIAALALFFADSGNREDFQYQKERAIARAEKVQTAEKP